MRLAFKMTTDRKTMLTLLALDVAVAILSFNVIANFRGITTHPILGPLVFPVFVLVAAVYLIDGYNGRTDMLSLDYFSLHAIAVLAALLVTLLLTFVVFPQGYELQSSRGVIALTFLLFLPLSIGYRRMIYLQAAPGRSESSFIFIGDHAACQAFREECWRMGMQQPVINSVIGEGATAAVGTIDALRQPFDDLLAEARAGSAVVEAIVLREANLDLPPEIAKQLVHLFFEGVPTYTLEFFHQVYWNKIPLYRLNPAWLFQDGFRITREPVFERIKRVSDVALSAAGLVLASPVIAIAIAAIWIEDRGAVFFRQTRIGKNGVSFRLLKLRTMRAGTEKDDPYTRPGDARITRVGGFLRSAHLDELPQLWNVLRGDMSLIGPRAEWDRLVEDYEKQIPCYYFRHLVKPGITGWAQVNYLYGASLDDTIRKLEYDLYYIRYFSFRLDASIVLKTIHLMLFGKGR
jgi:exopolysaccharide biosynthesis polyprenyl glycosylphosphotransferase